MRSRQGRKMGRPWQMRDLESKVRGSCWSLRKQGGRGVRSNSIDDKTQRTARTDCRGRTRDLLERDGVNSGPDASHDAVLDARQALVPVDSSVDGRIERHDVAVHRKLEMPVGRCRLEGAGVRRSSCTSSSRARRWASFDTGFSLDGRVDARAVWCLRDNLRTVCGEEDERNDERNRGSAELL